MLSASNGRSIIAMISVPMLHDTDFYSIDNGFITVIFLSITAIDVIGKKAITEIETSISFIHHEYDTDSDINGFIAIMLFILSARIIAMILILIS